MRRLFATHLLVLMPLQAAWAAVSVYCQHETGAAAEHFGHHDHLHHADDDGAGDSSALQAAAWAGGDSDCGACHAGCAFGVPPVARVLPLSIPGRAPPVFVLPALAEHASTPERPNWPAAA
jgi:hypothetical protein